MKRSFLIALTVFSCSLAFAEEAEKIETLSSKIILQDTNGYFVLSDGSCWKVIGFSKRWRSLSEWWNDVKLAPETYECVPNDWYVGTQVEAHAKYNKLEAPEANASNQDALKQCTHLLINTRTKQVLFAIALQPADCMIQIFNEASREGYNRGFNEGRSKGYQNSREIYNNGHAEGVREGYREGYRAAMNGEQPGS
jgi:hypothetical protein